MCSSDLRVCMERWTVYKQEAEPKPVSVRRKDGKSKTDACRTLCRDDVVAILMSKEPQRILAARYKLSRQAISLIKLGYTYKDIYEELQLPEQNKVQFCCNCLHWNRESCGLGFPEAGERFATECVVYQQKVKTGVIQ